MKRAEHLQKGHGGNTSYRTTSATEAKELLNEARGNMNRYKQYSAKQYKKGFEMHPNEINTINAPDGQIFSIKVSVSPTVTSVRNYSTGELLNRGME